MNQRFRISKFNVSKMNHKKVMETSSSCLYGTCTCLVYPGVPRWVLVYLSERWNFAKKTMKSPHFGNFESISMIWEGRTGSGYNQRIPSDRADRTAWDGVAQKWLDPLERPQKGMGSLICVFCHHVIHFWISLIHGRGFKSKPFFSRILT